ncbi:MAG: tail fiber protein [Chitinophagaceae bacterium]|nr:tail fiber protein [Chitinophagaceae bacterium]
MSDQPFIGEIKLFGGNFAIRGHAFCAGQLIPISGNEALFSLIGTTYGGDGQTNFALPDLRGRIPVHQGSSGSSTYVIGQSGGFENVTLLTSQIPAHTHVMNCNPAVGTQTNPSGNFWAAQPALAAYASTGSAPMKANAVSNSGGSQPHTNQQPYIAINYLIATEGIFPSRN